MNFNSQTWGIIPVKGFCLGKGRLAQALSPRYRRTLNREMLQWVVRTVLASSLKSCLITTPDEETALWCQTRGLLVHLDGGKDINASLNDATAWAKAQGADSVLILPADIPLVTVKDIESILSLGQEPLSLVVASCRRGEGTNALFLRPPGIIPFAFGPGSFKAHLSLGREVGVKVHIYQSETLGLDVDLREDLELLRNSAFSNEWRDHEGTDGASR